MIPRSCPVAQRSRIEVGLPLGVPYHISPEPFPVVNGSHLAIYDLKDRTWFHCIGVLMVISIEAIHVSAFENLDVTLKWPFENRFQPSESKLLPKPAMQHIRRGICIRSAQQNIITTHLGSACANRRKSITRRNLLYPHQSQSLFVARDCHLRHGPLVYRLLPQHEESYCRWR